MTPLDALSVGLAVIASLGGSGVIILGLSNWLGKVWAERIMAKDRATHARELETLRAELEKQNFNEIESLRHELDIFKHQQLKGFNDKIQIYRMASDMLSGMLAELDFLQSSGQLQTGRPFPGGKLHEFNKTRMQIYAYIGMLAPQDVMNAYEALIGHLFKIMHGETPYVWENVQGFILPLLNLCRKDIGISPTPLDKTWQD